MQILAAEVEHLQQRLESQHEAHQAKLEHCMGTSDAQVCTDPPLISQLSSHVLPVGNAVTPPPLQFVPELTSCFAFALPLACCRDSCGGEVGLSRH